MIHFVPIDNIVVPENRQRTDIASEKVTDLANDIQLPHGLLQALVLRDDGITLVVGERRLRALSYLNQQGATYTFSGQPVPPGHAPCIFLGELSEAALYEAELSENIRRVDLTWQEVTQARAELARLRRRQSTDPVSVTDRATFAEFAQQNPDLLGPDAGRKAIRHDLLLAENMHRPEVADAKNKQQALRALLRQQETELSQELVRRHGLAAFKSKHRCLQGSAGDILADFAPHQFDAIVTDPPYGVDAQTFNDQATVKHTYDDSPEHALATVRDILALGAQVCKPEAHLYMFLDFSNWTQYEAMAMLHGWKVWPRPIVWVKGPHGHLPRPDHGPRYTTEYIMFATLGDRPVTGVFHDHIICAPVQTNKLHAAQKPVAVIEDLIRRCCRPGDSVLDPCCGSGTIFPAAERQTVSATGLELDPEIYSLAFNRMGNPNE